MHNNIAVRRLNINIPANKAITAKKKTNTYMLASRTAITSRKSDTSKSLKKIDTNKTDSNLYHKKYGNAMAIAHDNIIFPR